jgi:hypothetical protein
MTSRSGHFSFPGHVDADRTLHRFDPGGSRLVQPPGD